MESILISACLLGVNCKYNGKNNYKEEVEKIKEKYNLILICPESDGRLPTPRVPSEILNDKVVNKENIDVTKEFTLGAAKALELANRYNVKKALLKDGSPSCGSTYIYDGTFTGTKIDGNGVTAKLLKANGIAVYSENQIDELLGSQK